MVTPLRRKTIIGWVIACVVFIGLLGYEWMPEYLRGGWIFYLLLVISGGFLEIGLALIVGTIAFIGSAFYLLYKLNLGLPAEKQALMLFLSPIAPLWLSAVKHNLGLRQSASKALMLFRAKSDIHVLDLDACEDFMRRLDVLSRHGGREGYRLIDIAVKNHDLITEMLGEQVWQKTRLQMLAIFEASANQAIFHFADDELTEFRCIDLEHAPDDMAEPEFLRQLRAIVELKLEVETHRHVVPGLESQS